MVAVRSRMVAVRSDGGINQRSLNKFLRPSDNVQTYARYHGGGRDPVADVRRQVLTWLLNLTGSKVIQVQYVLVSKHPLWGARIFFYIKYHTSL